MLQRVVVGKAKVWIEVDRTKLVRTLLVGKPDPSTTLGQHGPETIKISADFQPVHRGGELRLVAPRSSSPERTPDPTLVKAIARARDWYEQIIAGDFGTVKELAQKTGLPSSYTKRILQCAMLSPQITEVILSGKHGCNLTLHELLGNIPMDWREQDKGTLGIV